MFLATWPSKNHGICSGFCFSPRKNTVNNSNFAVFSCFSLFFELRWSAIHGYQILRVFFPTISTFGCFWSQWPTSLAVYERLPNDAVRGGCRREATWIYLHTHTTVWTLRSPKRRFLSLRRRTGMARLSMASTIWPSARRRSSLNPWTMMVSRHGKSLPSLSKFWNLILEQQSWENHGISMFCYRWYTWFLTSRIGWIGCMFCVWKRATLEKEPFFPKQRVHTEEFLQ